MTNGGGKGVAEKKNQYPPVVPKLDTARLDSGIQHHHAAKIGMENHNAVPVAETSIAMFAYTGVGHALCCHLMSYYGIVPSP